LEGVDAFIRQQYYFLEMFVGFRKKSNKDNQMYAKNSTLRKHRPLKASEIGCFLLSFLTISPTFAQEDRPPPLNVALKETSTRLIIEGERLRLEGEYERSSLVLERGLKLSRRAGEKNNELSCLLNLGLDNWNSGRLQESTDYFKAASDLCRRLSNKETERRCAVLLEVYRLYQEGKDFRSAEQYPQSIKSFTAAIELARSVNSPDHEVKCLRQLSSTYWQINDYNSFYLLSSQALEIAASLNHKKEEGYCYNNIGLYYWKIDSYTNSLSFFEKALAVAKDTNNAQNESDCLNNMGLIYRDMGNYDKALEYLSQALQLDQNLGNKQKISIDLNNIGATFRNRGLLSGKQEDYLSAKANLSHCLEIAKNLGDQKTEIRVLNNIGAVYSDLSIFAEAAEYFEQAYHIAQSIEDGESMSMILNNLGIVQFNIGNIEESTSYFRRAINIAQDIRGGQVLWEAYLEIGNAYKKQDRIKEALQNYKSSIAVVESIRSSIGLEELRASYLGSDKRIEAYQNLIDLLANQSVLLNDRAYGAEAFNYLERAKARAFLDSFEVSEVNISQGIDIKLANEEKEIMRQISQSYTQLLNPSLSSEAKDILLLKIKELEDESDRLKREIRTTSPAYANLKYPEVITYDEARNSLVDKSTTFFAYSLGKDRSFVFALSGGGLKVFVAPARKTLQQQVAEYRKVISDKDNQDFSLGHVLFKELVLPGLDKSTKKIVFVPDDILNLLPFETLVSEAGTTRWLVQDHPVSYVPSLSSLRELNRRRSASRIRPHKDLLAFGDPFYGANEENRQNASTDIFQDFYSNSSINFFRLKFSGLEIQKIAAAFKPSRTDVFRRQEATEDRLKAEPLTNYRIIHFATHGLIDDKKPARSSIILALDQDPGEDGFLQMREVFNLRMNADLVTLSACQTGLGQFIRGEGIEGLSRAFFYAGASSVLMSLWAVNDEATYQLMERFYGYLRESETPMNALRRAKLEMIGSGVLSHPYYWAGFIVNGKSDTVIFPGTVKRWVLLASSLCAGIMILVALRNLNRRRT
jgi:CHAT domain-containing protein/tetratricopeptide (TPR) repeat protein